MVNKHLRETCTSPCVDSYSQTKCKQDILMQCIEMCSKMWGTLWDDDKVYDKSKMLRILCMYIFLPLMVLNTSFNKSFAPMHEFK